MKDGTSGQTRLHLDQIHFRPMGNEEPYVGHTVTGMKRDWTRS